MAKAYLNHIHSEILFNYKKNLAFCNNVDETRAGHNKQSKSEIEILDYITDI